MMQCAAVIIQVKCGENPYMERDNTTYNVKRWNLDVNPEIQNRTNNHLLSCKIMSDYKNNEE
jgi:hypothetical protein